MMAVIRPQVGDAFLTPLVLQPDDINCEPHGTVQITDTRSHVGDVLQHDQNPFAALVTFIAHDDTGISIYVYRALRQYSGTTAAFHAS